MKLFNGEVFSRLLQVEVLKNETAENPVLHFLALVGSECHSETSRV